MLLMTVYLRVDHSMVLAGEVHVLFAHALDEGRDGLALSILWLLDLQLWTICVLKVLDHEARVRDHISPVLHPWQLQAHKSLGHHKCL